MYGRGHAHGTRRQSRTQSAWYDTIAEATLAQLDATWPDSTPTPQEVTHEHTQAVGSTDQAQHRTQQGA